MSSQQLCKMYGESCKILETKAYWTEGKHNIVRITVPIAGKRNKKVATRTRSKEDKGKDKEQRQESESMDEVCKDDVKEIKTKAGVEVRHLEMQLQ